MRKIFTSLFLISFAFCTQAQHLPNSSFENWKGSCGETYQSSNGSLWGGSKPEGMRQRPGDEPADWSGSSINQRVVAVSKSEVLISKSTGRVGAAVKMQNKYVGAAGVGSNAPAFISFATPWVYAVTTISKCDGGVYGGMAFNHRPDAIKGWFKRTGDTGEKAHIIAYLWKGTFKSSIASSADNDTKDDVDRTIMNATNTTGSEVRIASCDYSFTSTTNNDWQEITVPLHYNSNDVPEKVNVIISSGDYWTRDNVKEGSILEADDVQFVYYSELASLSYDGVSYFGQDVNGIFEVPLEYGEAFDESKLSVSSNGRSASIEKKYNADTQVLTVTIKGGDYALNKGNVHEYIVNFASDEPVIVEPELGEVLTSIDNADVNSTYVLYNEYYNQYAVYNPAQASNVWAVANDDSFDLTSANNSWMVMNVGGKYYLANVGAKGYLDTAGGNSVFASAATPLSVVPLADNGFAFNATEENTNFMCTSFRPGTSVATWTSDNQGAAWQLIANPNVEADPSLVPAVTNPTPQPKPEEPKEPEEPEPVIDYTPSYTGVKTVTEESVQNARAIQYIKVISATYADEVENIVYVDNSERLCYNDYMNRDTVLVAPGEEITVEVNIGNGSWINSYVYIDTDKNGFTASIAGDGHTPLEDLVSYSFYNGGGTSDTSGRNSVGTHITGDSRNTVTLPPFTVTDVMKVYTMRVKTDWSNIDPNGDKDGMFGDFMDNGGQIVDFKIRVIDPETLAGIEDVTAEELVKGIYDMQGRKLEDITAPGMYIIDGKKRMILK